jgi:hypothetical protein
MSNRWHNGALAHLTTENWMSGSTIVESMSYGYDLEGDPGPTHQNGCTEAQLGHRSDQSQL